MLVAVDSSTEADLDIAIYSRELPRRAIFQPFVRRLALRAVFEVLMEHAELVTDAVSERGYVHRRHRVEEARGEPSEAAVTESGIRLDVLQLLEVTAAFGEFLTKRRLQP